MNSIKKALLGIAAIAAVAAFPTQADAQVRFGVKAGTVINKLQMDNLSQYLDVKNNAGYTVGAMAEFTVPIIGVGADVSAMYSHMGAQLIEGDEETNPAKDFLEIPINFKYKLTLPAVSQIVKPMVYTGPDFAFKLSGDDGFLQSGFSKFQFGWNLGVGVELFNHLQVQGGYTFGCNNIAKNLDIMDNNNLIDDVKVRNSYWTISAAWLF